MSCCPTPLTDELRRVLDLPPAQPLYFDPDACSTYSAFGHELHLDAAHCALDDARAALAHVVRAQDPDSHFCGLPESAEVIAAYDTVRAAEAAVAKLERNGRRS